MPGKLFNVSILKAAIGSGAKSDKYAIEFGAPPSNTSFTLGENGSILCKSASFPSVKIDAMPVWVQGRKIVLPGDTEYQNTWDLDFYQTADHKLRQMFIEWMKNIDDYASNNHTCFPSEWMVEAVVMQLGCDGVPTAKYRFFNMWPSNIGEVKVDGSQINTLEEFTITFAYSHWSIEPV